MDFEEYYERKIEELNYNLSNKNWSEFICFYKRFKKYIEKNLDNVRFEDKELFINGDIKGIKNINDIRIKNIQFTVTVLDNISLDLELRFNKKGDYKMFISEEIYLCANKAPDLDKFNKTISLLNKDFVKLKELLYSEDSKRLLYFMYHEANLKMKIERKVLN